MFAALESEVRPVGEEFRAIVKRAFEILDVDGNGKISKEEYMYVGCRLEEAGGDVYNEEERLADWESKSSAMGDSVETWIDIMCETVRPHFEEDPASEQPLVQQLMERFKPLAEMKKSNMIEQLRRMFQVLDSDRSGLISLEEWRDLDRGLSGKDYNEEKCTKDYNAIIQLAGDKPGSTFSFVGYWTYIVNNFIDPLKAQGKSTEDISHMFDQITSKAEAAAKQSVKPKDQAAANGVEMDPELRAVMMKLFDMVDVDGDGTWSQHEYLFVCRMMAINTGEVDFHDWEQVLAWEKKKAAEFESTVKVRGALRSEYADRYYVQEIEPALKDPTKNVTPQSMAQILQQSIDKIADMKLFNFHDAIQTLWKLYDANSDGWIDFEEFLLIEEDICLERAYDSWESDVHVRNRYMGFAHNTCDGVWMTSEDFQRYWYHTFAVLGQSKGFKDGLEELIARAQAHRAGNGEISGKRRQREKENDQQNIRRLQSAEKHATILGKAWGGKTTPDFTVEVFEDVWETSDDAFHTWTKESLNDQLNARNTSLEEVVMYTQSGNPVATESHKVANQSIFALKHKPKEWPLRFVRKVPRTPWEKRFKFSEFVQKSVSEGKPTFVLWYSPTEPAINYDMVKYFTEYACPWDEHAFNHRWDEHGHAEHKIEAMLRLAGDDEEIRNAVLAGADHVEVAKMKGCKSGRGKYSWHRKINFLLLALEEDKNAIYKYWSPDLTYEGQWRSKRISLARASGKTRSQPLLHGMGWFDMPGSFHSAHHLLIGRDGRVLRNYNDLERPVHCGGEIELLLERACEEGYCYPTFSPSSRSPAEKLVEMFTKYDKDGDGLISFDELRSIMMNVARNDKDTEWTETATYHTKYAASGELMTESRDAKQGERVQNRSWDDHSTRQMFDAVDSDGSGFIDAAEFAAWLFEDDADRLRRVFGLGAKPLHR